MRQELADKFGRAVEDFLAVLQTTSKVDEALVREFQGTTKDLAAALQKKEFDKSKVADLQKKTSEMLSVIRGEFQVDKALVGSLHSAAMEVLEAVRCPETINPALVQDLQAVAVALLDSLGPLPSDEQARVTHFQIALSELIEAIRHRPELDFTLQARFEQSLNHLALAVQASGIAPEKTEQLRRLGSAFVTKLKGIEREFLHGLVNPGVLPIYPADPEHLNGTFHFCASVGMERKRVYRSIANGCFQTLGTLADELKASDDDTRPSENVTLRSVGALLHEGLIPQIQWSSRQIRQEGYCPFFVHSAKPYESYTNHRLQTNATAEPFKCPFFEAGSMEAKKVYKACRKDSVHDKAFDLRQERGKLAGC